MWFRNVFVLEKVGFPQSLIKQSYGLEICILICFHGKEIMGEPCEDMS